MANHRQLALAAVRAEDERKVGNLGARPCFNTVMARLLWLFALSIVCGCAPNGRRFVPPPRALELDKFSSEAEGPFRVLHAAPQGAITAETQIALVFSRPLRALTLTPPPAPSLNLTPPVAGVWQWVGTHALLFTPEQQRFPAATRLRLLVPTSLQALDGSVLEAPFELRFETARPEVEFWDHSLELEVRERIEIFTNQPVRLEDLRQLLSVQVQGLSDAGTQFYSQAESAEGPVREPLEYGLGVGVPFCLEPGPEGDNQSFVLLADGHWPSERRLRFSVGAGLAGLEGTLRTETTVEMERTTAGLAVATLQCDTSESGCRPDTVSVELSEPVDPEELESLVQIEPAAKWVASAWRVSFPELRAKQHYELVLGAGLRSRRGVATPHAQRLRFRTGGPKPPEQGLGFALEQGHIEPQYARPVLLEMQHIDRFQQAVHVLDPSDLARLWSTHDPLEYSVFIEELLRGAWSTRSVPATDHNRYQTSIDPAPLLASTEGHGALLFGARSDGISHGPSLAVVQLSDLALTARLSPFGGQVFVTSLSTLAPLDGAKVTLLSRGEPQATAVSDDQGLAQFESGILPAALDYDADYSLLAERGNDWSLISLNSSEGHGLAFGLDETLEPIVQILVDRNRYRPGERVHVKGIVRGQTPERHEPLERAAVDLWLSVPNQAQSPKPQRVFTSELGSFDSSFDLPKDAALGSWSVHAKVRDTKVERYFAVSEYRPTSFESQITAAQDSVCAGDLARFTVHGEYLFGQPMAGGQIEWRAKTESAHFRPPIAFQYVTDSRALDQSGSFAPVHSALSKSVLDAQGQATIETRAPADRLQASWLSLEASVSDLSRQTHGHRATILVHPAAFYLGLDAPNRAQAGHVLRPKVVAVTPGGGPVRNVSVELVLSPAPPARNEREGLEPESDSGKTATNSPPAVVARCQLATADSAQSCALIVPPRGEYFLEARAKDAQGRSARAAQRLTVTVGATAQTIGPGWTDRNHLKLALDREHYLFGDQARLTVRSPVPRARAYVTLQRHGVLWQTERVIGREANFTVPITSRIGRNATVSVLIHPLPLRRSATISRFASTPASCLYDEIELEVDPNQWRLQVKVEPAQAKLKPGETSSIDLQVLGSDGLPRSTEVALWAVDESVLLLDEDTRVDDWLPSYTELRLNTVSTYDTRAKLGWLYEPITTTMSGSHSTRAPRVRLGATMMGSRESWLAVRQEPKAATAFFLPSLRTDAQGRVKVPFTAPQALSRFRIRAVALTKDGEFGSAESQFTTSLPLMLRTALPRFARPKDELEAGVILTSASPEPLTARVEARAQGLSGRGSQAVRTVTLGPGTSQEVRFPWRALAPTTARLEFRVEASGLTDGIASELPVLDRVEKETIALYGDTRGERREMLGDLSAADPAHNEFTLTLGSSPLVDVGSSVDELINYPYTCTEQLASKLIALGPGVLVARHTGQAVAADIGARRRALVSRILSNQTAGGGVGYWPDATPSPWLSSYVYLGLHQAKTLGTAVPERALDRLSQYLHHQLSRVSGVTPRSGLMSQAFLQNALATSQEHDRELTECIHSLWKQRNRLGNSGRALLLGAMAAYRGAPASWKQRRISLAHRLEGALRLSANQAFVSEEDGPKALLESADRTTALVLRALLAHDPNHVMVPLVVRGLLAQRRHGSWSSTQASAWALVALSDYLRAVPGAQSQFVAEAQLGAERLWNAVLGSEVGTTREVTLSGKPLPSHAPLVFRKRGPGTLFYSARLTYVSQGDTLAPEARGFDLTSLIGRLTSHADVPPAEALRGETEVPLGQPLIGEVQVIVPTVRHHVVIEVPLAAGLEPIDPELTTASPWLRYQDFYGTGTRNRWHKPTQYRHWYDFTLPGMQADVRRELRDDRILFFVERLEPGLHRFTYLVRATSLGEFEMPAAHVEEMYQPEHFARSRPVRVRVVESHRQ